MWIVRLALNRPYTFIVLAILILIATPVVILRTPTDIFPSIDIPVVSVAWQYTGLQPEELEGRLTTPLRKDPHRCWSTTSSTPSPPPYARRGRRQDLPPARRQFRRTPPTPRSPPPPRSSLQASCPPGITLARRSSTSAPRACPSCSSAFPARRPLRAAAERLRPQNFVRRPARHRPRRRRAQSLRRQAALHPDQSSTPRPLQAQGLSPTDVLSSLMAVQNVVQPGGTAKIGMETSTTSSSTASPLDA